MTQIHALITATLLAVSSLGALANGVDPTAPRTREAVQAEAIQATADRLHAAPRDEFSDIELGPVAAPALARDRASVAEEARVAARSRLNTPAVVEFADEAAPAATPVRRADIRQLARQATAERLHQSAADTTL